MDTVNLEFLELEFIEVRNEEKKLIILQIGISFNHRSMQFTFACF